MPVVPNYLVMEGQLRHAGKEPSCKFEVYSDSPHAPEDKETFTVLLISHYSGAGIVDTASGLSATEVFSWLRERTDY